MATVYDLRNAKGKTFKTSDFKVVDSGKTSADIKRGWYAYYVPYAAATTGENATAEVLAYYAITATKPAAATAVNVFRVFNTSFEDEYELLGLDMVELELI